MAKEQLKQDKVFNATSSFGKFWNTNILKMNVDIMRFIEEITYQK